MLEKIPHNATGIEPKRINGTGVLAQRTFWLGAGNDLYRNAVRFEKNPGSLMVAVNEWTDYFNVRINQLALRAGTEVILKVRPSQHSTSEGFKDMSLEDRGCRFTHENEVCSSV